jgi:hypothetical protein
METFAKLFGSLLAFVYHRFDRIVILGYLPLLSRPENIVHFFRDVHQTGAITKEVLRQRTDEYNHWVEAMLASATSPWSGPKRTSTRKTTCGRRCVAWNASTAFGVYFILKSMEIGPTFRSSTPRFATSNENCYAAAWPFARTMTPFWPPTTPKPCRPPPTVSVPR